MANSLQDLLSQMGVSGVFAPPELETEIRQVGEWVFGTRTPPHDLYDYYPYVVEAATANPDDYLLLGQAGHGMQSYALHYYLVEASLALFLQLEWGGAYGNHDAERRAIGEQMALVPQLWAATREWDLAPDEHLVVALSDMHGARWAVLPRGMTEAEFMAYGDWFTGDLADITPVLDWVLARSAL